MNRTESGPDLGARYRHRVLIGYERVSTADQNPPHQIYALTRASVAERDIHIDTASEPASITRP